MHKRLQFVVFKKKKQKIIIILLAFIPNIIFNYIPYNTKKDY